MHRRCSTVVLLACLALAAFPALAEQPPIVRLRIDGADTATRALTRVGAPIGEASLLAPIAEQLGLGELSWLDGRRPAAVVLPFGGMTSGAGGMVAVLPYAGELDAALGKLGAAFDNVSEADGVHRMSRDGGASIALVAGDGHFVIGTNAALVRQVDASAALALGDLPPGPAAIELELEAVAPIIQLGLMQGRQVMQQQMEAAGDEAALPTEFLDVYFDGVRDLVSNTSRIQLAFDTAGDRLAIRTRVVPRGGSTLAGVAAAQRGGLPELLKLIDADGAQMLYAGQITFTDALDEALAGYTSAYTDALANLLPALQQAGGPGAGGLDMIFELLGADAVAEWQACRAGEYAGRMDFAEDLQVRMLQLSRMRDADECLAIAGKFSERMKKIASDELPIKITPGALTHRGAHAFRIDMDMAALAGAENDEAAEMQSMTQFFGFAGQVAISTLGPEGEAQFKTAVNRALDGRKSGDGRVPAAADFAPLEPAAGMLIALDLGALVGAMPREDGEAVPAVEGRIVAGLRFVGARLDVDVSMPLAAIDALRELSDGNEPTAVAPATGAATGAAR